MIELDERHHGSQEEAASGHIHSREASDHETARPSAALGNDDRAVRPPANRGMGAVFRVRDLQGEDLALKIATSHRGQRARARGGGGDLKAPTLRHLLREARLAWLHSGRLGGRRGDRLDRTWLFRAGTFALLLATLTVPAHADVARADVARADVARDLARLIQTQGTDPLGFIRGLRGLGDVELGEEDIRRALSLLPRNVQTNADIRRLVDPVTRIRIKGSSIEIDRRNAPTLGFGARAVKLERKIRLRVRSDGSDVVIDDIDGVRVGSPQSLYKLLKVTFTTQDGKPVAKVKVLVGRAPIIGNITHTATVDLDADATESPGPMAEGMDPALLEEVEENRDVKTDFLPLLTAAC